MADLMSAVQIILGIKMHKVRFFFLHDHHSDRYDNDVCQTDDDDRF